MTSAAVAGPVVLGPGDQAARASTRRGRGGRAGMWAGSVAYWPRPQRRRWEAMRRPLRKISTVVAVEADLDALVHELVGDAVVVVLDGDVVVDVHGGVAPLGRARSGWRAAGAGAGGRAARRAGRRETPSFFMRPVVEASSSAQIAAFSSARLKKRWWRSGRQDPALGHQHVGLDDRLVPRVARRGPGTTAAP